MLIYCGTVYAGRSALKALFFMYKFNKVSKTIPPRGLKPLCINGKYISMGKTLPRIEKYWTNRAQGYSNLNKWQLGCDSRQRWHNVLIRELPKGNPAEIKVLDMGCGPGFFSIILAEDGFDVTAADYTEEMLEKARENAEGLENITFTRQDAQNLTLPDNSFDVIVSRNLTWVLEEPERAYAEWFRVLKKGGILLNFDANWYAYLYDDEKRRGYERDRKNVEMRNMKDHFIGTDIDEMEAIALKVPLTAKKRPVWDKLVLKNTGFKTVITDTEIWQLVWTETEKVNHGSMPLFMVKAIK